MIDSHCHIAGPEFVADLSAVIDRAKAARLSHALVILAADDAAEIHQAAVVAAAWEGVRFSVGVHPHAAASFAADPADAADLSDRVIAGEPLTRAVGEIGLDYHYDFAPREVQRQVFREQIRLARQRRLPIVIVSAGAAPADAPPAVSGVANPALAGVERLASPHPAVVALALLLAPLDAFELRRAVATVLLPVSLAGEGGIDELFSETRALLTFQSPPKAKRFGSQIAFNVFPAALDAGELERATLAALGLELPLTVQALQAGFFHSVGISLHVELGASPPAADLRKALGRAPHLELAKQAGRLGPVAAAGGERLLIGDVQMHHEPQLNLLYGTGAILLLALAMLVIRFGSNKYPSGPGDEPGRK